MAEETDRFLERAASFAAPTASTAKVREVGRLEAAMAADRKVYGFSWYAGEVPHPSRLVKDFATPGKPFSYPFDEMDWKDCGTYGMIYRVLEAIVSMPRRVVARDESDAAKEARDMVIEALSGIAGLSKAISRLYEKVPDGIAFVELDWTERGGVLYPWRAEPRPMEAFGFKWDQETASYALHVRRSGQLIPAPLGKFLYPTHGTRNAPWGWGLKEVLHYPWQGRVFTLLDWQLANERWARPTVIVQYQPAATGDKDEDEAENQRRENLALELGGNIHADGVAAFPVGTFTVEIKPPTADSGEMRGFHDTLGREIARLVLGEVNTAGLRPGVGAYASDSIAEGLSHRKTVIGGNDLCSYLGDTLFSDLVAANLPGAPVPRMVIDTTPEEAARLIMDGLTKAAELELDEPLRVPRSHVYGALRIPEPLPDDETVVLGRSGNASRNQVV